MNYFNYCKKNEAEFDLVAQTKSQIGLILGLLV